MTSRNVNPNYTVVRGFTIVELLIVIVVIAILAAITTVAYNGIQNRAYDAAVKADLSTVAKKVQMFRVVNGIYPTSSGDLTALEVDLSKDAYSTDTGNAIMCSDQGEFAFAARSKSGNAFFVSSHYGEVKEYELAWNGTISTCSDLTTVEAGARVSSLGWCCGHWYYWVK